MVRAAGQAPVPRTRPSPRALAAEALRRIDDGGFANLVVPAVLAGCALAERDRAFVTELVYGTTRMRRACDWLVDRFLFRPVDDAARAALRLGAYQLVFLATPPHAAVAETVGLVPGPGRGLVNAVLRRVAEAGRPDLWPDLATRLSYPDWIVRRLTDDLGEGPALAALEQMNEPARPTRRSDGYIQDISSQVVAGLVADGAGERVVDLCAAPGGKATFIAGASPGSLVVAGDRHPGRAGLVAQNAHALGYPGVATYVGDGRSPPLRPAAFDHVLVDAPCSGLGVLRRRPDARWRIEEDALAGLVALQRELLGAGVALAHAGGRLTYSVCTMTEAETTGNDAWLADRYPAVTADGPLPPGWAPQGRGARVLPQDHGGDAMFVLRLRLGP